MEKAELRRAAKALQRALTPEERKRIDEAICAHITGSNAYREANTVFAYAGIGWEIDTMPLLMQILRDGKRLCLPRVSEKPRMEAAEVKSLAALTKDRYGIPSPSSQLPTVAPEGIDLALVPCVAATQKAFRLGQGGGYYDAFLANYRGTSFLLARQCAVLPALPLEDHDQCCTVLVTEKGIIYP